MLSVPGIGMDSRRSKSIQLIILIAGLASLLVSARIFSPGWNYIRIGVTIFLFVFLRILFPLDLFSRESSIVHNTR